MTFLCIVGYNGKTNTITINPIYYATELPSSCSLLSIWIIETKNRDAAIQLHREFQWHSITIEDWYWHENEFDRNHHRFQYDLKVRDYLIRKAEDYLRSLGGVCFMNSIDLSGVAELPILRYFQTK